MAFGLGEKLWRVSSARTNDAYLMIPELGWAARYLYFRHVAAYTVLTGYGTGLVCDRGRYRGGHRRGRSGVVARQASPVITRLVVN